MALESRSLDDYADDALVWLSRGLNKGWSKPDWVSVNLTLKCNLACTFCKTCYPVRQELSTREIKDIIDQTFLWGVKRFNPIGGEPFVRADLEAILAHAARRDMHTTLTTNGTLIKPERAARVAQIPVEKLHINISLDGPELAHDSVRGEGTWQRTMAGYRALRDADVAAGVTSVVGSTADSLPQPLVTTTPMTAGTSRSPTLLMTGPSGSRPRLQWREGPRGSPR